MGADETLVEHGAVEEEQESDEGEEVEEDEGSEEDEAWEEFSGALEPNNNITIRPASEDSIEAIEKKPYEWFAKAKESVIDGLCRICMDKFDEKGVIAAMSCTHFFR